MKKILTIWFLLNTYICAYPHDFCYGDLYYTILSEEDKTVELVRPGATYESFDYLKKEDIVIPDIVSYNNTNYQVVKIGEYVFYPSDCKSVTIPNTVVCIEHGAFSNCHNLTSVFIPQSVREIGTSVFFNCSSLAEIIIDPQNDTYDSRDNCNAIIESKTKTLQEGCKSSFIPNTIVHIGDDAFVWKRLNQIEIPNSVETIGHRAFQENEFESIFIPSSVKSIEATSFGMCYSLKHIIVDKENNTYDSRNNCNAIIETSTNTLIAGCPSTIIPDGVDNIGASAFDHCYFFSDNLVIPSGVKSIGECAFFASNLRAITIPSSVTNIEHGVFYACNYLTDISTYSPVPQSLSSQIKYNHEYKTLHTLKGTKELYEQSNYWNEFYVKDDLEGILKQPTKDDLSVKVTFEDAASYQWYCEIETLSFADWTSTNHSNNSISRNSFLLNLNVGQSFSFDWSVSSEQKYDKLNVSMNGETIIVESGEKSGIYSYTAKQNETIEIIATYTKDGSGNYGSDHATITNFHVNEYSILINNSKDESLPDEDLSISGNYYCVIKDNNSLEEYTSDKVYMSALLKWNDGVDYKDNRKKHEDRLIYTRTFSSADKWQALYVPFSIPVDVLTENGLEVAELNNIHMYDTDGDKQFDKTTLEFLYLTDGETEANYPYLIKSANAGEVKLMLKDVELKAAAETQIECASTRKVFKIKGTYSGVSGADMFNNNYYAVGGGTLVKAASADNALKPQRWYMSIENKDGSPVDYFAPKMRIMINGMEIDEEETGIQDIAAPTVEDVVYTLDGRKMNASALPSGIYVKNHKKMIVQ